MFKLDLQIEKNIKDNMLKNKIITQEQYLKFDIIANCHYYYYYHFDTDNYQYNIRLETFNKSELNENTFINKFSLIIDNDIYYCYIEINNWN
jgi:hypothetical protein